MKISTCHNAKMRKHSNGVSGYICSACGYASGSIDTVGKKYKRSVVRGVVIYHLIKADPIPPTYKHYPHVSI